MFTPEQIATATGAPLANAAATWPQTVAAMRWVGIYDHFTQIAMAATIAVETGVTENGQNMTFLPCTELNGPSTSYAPWYGRGTIQCTFEYNYAHFGEEIGVNLLANPDLALRQDVSAKIAVLYFREHGIPAMANAQNWDAVRFAVNGGWYGLAPFLQYVRNLEAMQEAPDGPPVTRVAVKDWLRTVPKDNGPEAINPQHKKVALSVGTVIHFTTDPAPGEYHGKVTTPHWACIRVADSPVWGWYLRDHLSTSFQAAASEPTPAPGPASAQ